MSGEKKKIVFTGKLVEGVEPGQVLKNLAGLFKKPPEEIREKFKKGAVISSNLSAEKAEKAISALARAGAVCIAEPVSPQEIAEPATEPKEVKTTQQGHTGTDSDITSSETSGGFTILDIEEASPDLTLAPVNCNRIAGDESGLTTNRLDRSNIPFEHVVLAAVCAPAEDPESFHLILYSAGHKRPLFVDAKQISFSNFAGVPGSSLQSSLRNFLKFLAQKSPSFFIDRSTADFCDGGKPLIYAKDPLPLACSLYEALSAATNLLGQPAQPTQQKPKPSVTPPGPASSRPAAPQPADNTPAETVEVISPAEQFIDWSDRWQRPMLIALLVGFCLPLLKSSMLYDSVLLVWPWNQMGIGIDGSKAAAMATYSQGEWTGIYALLPLLTVVGIGIGMLQKLKSWRGLILFLLGALPLLASLTLFHREAEIYGIIHLPMAWEGGIMVFIVIVAVTLIAATNHIYKLSGPNLWLRILNGTGGGILLVATLLAAFAAPWNNWALYLLYIIFLALAGLSIKGTISGDPDSDTTSMVSLLLRGLLVWTPIATMTSQSGYDDPFVSYVVESGGGFISLLVASLKCYAIHYTMAFAMGIGLSGLLIQKIFKSG